MNMIEKVKAADHIEWMGNSYDYVGEDDIEVGATITQNPDGSIDTTFEVSERDW